MADSIDSLLTRLLPAWSAALKGEVSDAELARFARRHRAELTELLQAADKRRPPQWFERFNPRGAPGEDLEAARRAAAHAADLFDHVVHLLSLSPFDLDLQPALDVLGSSRDDPPRDYPFDERWWLDNDAAIRPTLSLSSSAQAPSDGPPRRPVRGASASPRAASRQPALESRVLIAA